MSLSRFAKKRDANEAEIFAALRAAGALVVALDRPCDALVGWGGRWYAIEIKRPTGAVGASQAEFMAECQRRNLPAAVVRSVYDAMQVIGAQH